MLTVAELSGIIAAGLMVVQYTLPAALVIVLISLIGTENTAATWSSVNRTISTTIWPLLLQADTVGARNRSWAAVALSWTMTFGAALLVLASVMTPLGLHEEILAATPGPVLFTYVPDKTAWGRLTMPRPDANFDRYCEYGRQLNCPGQYQGVDLVQVEPGIFQGIEKDASSTINTTVPANLTEIFTSATSAPGSTVSGLFDIQYRRFKTSYPDYINKGKGVVQGDFRTVETLLVEPGLHVREGLVIDTRDASPGIGFRNHTIPLGSHQGATWSEDLTWLEPVTKCVDTNLSIELTAVEKQDKPNMFLIDRGAFLDLDQKILESRVWGDNQTLDLQGRAYKAARMYNVLIAKYLNLTLPLRENMAPRNLSDPALGFNSDRRTFKERDFDRVDVSDIYGLNMRTSLDPGSVNVSVPEDFSGRDAEGFKLLFASNFTAIRDICRGYYELGEFVPDRRASNITNPGVECGMVFGAGITPGKGTPFDSPLGTADTDGPRQKSIFVCATAIRAGIKTVHFRYNGTGVQLSNLEAERVTDKVYTLDKYKPLWAVEASFPFRMTFDPLWGMVSDRYEAAEGISTMRSEKLWLPAIVSSALLGYGTGSLAAATGPVMQVKETYTTTSDLETLTGAFSYPIVERYGRLSTNATVASQIPSLMLTDSLASLLVGTKSAIRAAPVTYPARTRIDTPFTRLSAADVAVYRRVIRYDLRYAVPALLAAGLLAAVLCWVAVILAVARLDVLRRLRDTYNQTSTGRLATVLLQPGGGNPNESTSEWVEGNGRLMLAFGRIGTKGAGYFLRVQQDGEGGRPFLKPGGYDGYGQEGDERSSDAKGVGETVVRV
ncbi:hypothetical protein QBC39DRAFT_353599 [Podospora conica]|nr:hypothetical protein QBC39DRAFT_353599 [Schizothecium conicum]